MHVIIKKKLFEFEKKKSFIIHVYTVYGFSWMLVLAYFSGLEISDTCVYLLKRGIIYKIHIIMNSTLKQLLKFKAIYLYV